MHVMNRRLLALCALGFVVLLIFNVHFEVTRRIEDEKRPPDDTRGREDSNHNNNNSITPPLSVNNSFTPPLSANNSTQEDTRDSNKAKLLLQMETATRNASGPKNMRKEDEHGHHDPHSTRLAILDLVDWEATSLQGLLLLGNITLPPNKWTAEQDNQLKRSCRPPPGIPTSCCLGSISSGGGTVAKNRKWCAKSVAATSYESLYSWSQQAMLVTTTQVENRTACDVCQFLEQARQHNLTIAFLGDSVHSQIMTGLVCELARRGYGVETVRQPPFPEVLNNSKFKLNHWDQTTVTSPTWLSSNNKNTRVVLNYFNSFKTPVLFLSELQRIANANDVLVLGLGLHWNPIWSAENSEKMQLDFERFFSILRGHLQSNTSRLKFLMHRETTAQHFNLSATGQFLGKLAPDTTQCVAHNEYRSSLRDTIILKAAQRSNITTLYLGNNSTDNNNTERRMHHRPELVILPYHNYTRELYNMHSAGGRDCTHYCTTPFTWYPIWKGLREAIDWKYGNDARR